MRVEVIKGYTKEYGVNGETVMDMRELYGQVEGKKKEQLIPIAWDKREYEEEYCYHTFLKNSPLPLTDPWVHHSSQSVIYFSEPELSSGGRPGYDFTIFGVLFAM